MCQVLPTGLPKVPLKPFRVAAFAAPVFLLGRLGPKGAMLGQSLRDDEIVDA
jgi:hypothetical protein